jgi:UDP-glucuronate decarboxylase
MNRNIVDEDLENIISSDLPWEQFKDSTVLISGANGFLPAYMAETLLYLNTVRHLNIKVIGLVRNKDKALTRFSNYKNRDDLKLLIQDVCDPIDCTDKIDYIIHAASQASPKYYGIDPVGTLKANVIGTSNLLELAKGKNLSGFLYFSSSEIYGQLGDDDTPIIETAYGYLDPINIRSCYAESKRMGETISVSWFHQYDIPVKIIRPFHSYGPRMALDDGRVYADFAANILESKDIVLKSDGSAIRAFCYLADATKGFFTVLLKGENGHAYNVGNPECKASILELANQLVDLFVEKGLRVVRHDVSCQPYIQSKVSRIIPDINKIKALGWIPTTSINIGFKRTLESFL